MCISPSKDLITLVADKNMEATFNCLLSRNHSLFINGLSYDIFIHPNKDPGCYKESHTFLRSFLSQYRYAIVVFDRDGCGSQSSRDALESEVEHNLNMVGWEGRSCVVVLDPELEVWLWNRSPHVEEAIGWSDNRQTARNWLVQNGFMDSEDQKPRQPKEALEAVLRLVRKPRSSAIYKEIATRASLVGHEEPAFMKFVEKLQEWFSIINA